MQRPTTVARASKSHTATMTQTMINETPTAIRHRER